MSTGRWLIKKVARHAVALASVASGSLLARAHLRPGPRVRALTYHRFANEPRDAFCVSPEVFEAQVRELAQNGLAVTLDRLRRFVAGEEELPDGACLVTIDDGLMSTVTEALPVLRRWGVPAVAFVSAGLVGSKVRYPEPYMGWDELRALLDSGLVTIGSHAYTHRSLAMLPAAEARDEAKRSKDCLEERLGVPVHSFAYPFGTRADFSRVTDRALADAGYEIAFNSMHGVIRAGSDPISLPRVKVEGGEAPWMFELLRRGAMDAWRAVDVALPGLQRVRTEVGVVPFEVEREHGGRDPAAEPRRAAGGM
ncbi:MAG TPA: polysaccharide deacetylase family protein [Sandaracinaceae bacterium]